ncbi:FtsX-like permease family protein [Streptococcus panodentis]|uniref:ABC transporter permease n=1 Tax=Streptococcus panodentis TaxID=1581472 RepID=A0ABS5AT77_9STRE|nr:FtsX-like permease family protein [Streptococcus panodentis]MBP2619779.1 ABC transporter permease [Streptococcus panodentis]
MVISIKDVRKLLVVAVISFCAVLVSTLFANFYLDIQQLEVRELSAPALAYYDAQLLLAKFVSLISGGVLSLLALLMLFFYIKQFIDSHKEELGILKAFGYQNIQLAKHFWIFSFSVFIGSLLGFAASFVWMQDFYELRNQKSILPNIDIHFHGELFLGFVLLPTILFAIVAIGYAAVQLNRPSLYLLKRIEDSGAQPKRHRLQKERPFLKELSHANFYHRKMLIFFVLFSAFSFAAMMQLSFGMKDFIDGSIQMMMIGIGLALAASILLLSLGTLMQENKRALVLMKTFGYSQKECNHVILSKYRILAYIGFALGTLYQYMLMKLLLQFLAKDVAGVPDYTFNPKLCAFVFLLFVIFYESLVRYHIQNLHRLSLKEIMLAE